MESLRVALVSDAGSRAYPIHIGTGIIGSAELYRPHLGGGRVAIVTNAVVGPLYLHKLKHVVPSAVEIVLPDGEQTKSWETLNRVFDALLAARCGRDTLIVALGGGVIGDL